MSAWLLTAIMMGFGQPVPTSSPAQAGLAPLDVETLAVRARGNISNAFLMDDSPLLALQNGEQGRVRFRFRTGTDGRVTHCWIVDSSGSAILDAITCPLLQARARLTPAQDKQGNPAPDELSGGIVWQLP